MCDQKKAFYKSYDKKYTSKKVKDLVKKSIKIMVKFSEVEKGKYKLTSKEETLLKNQQKHRGEPKLMLSTMKAHIEERIVSDKDIEYMK